MRQLILLIAAQFILTTVSAQITYQEGYFIDNGGVKIEGLIKNVDWKNNPESFSYKSNQSSQPHKKSINDIQEFGISNSTKYVRATVQVDKSKTKLNSLGYSKEPEFEEKTIFLKVLAEGNATLYLYVDQSLTRFYFSKNEEEITPLIYKQYKHDSGKVRSNKQFKQQLWNNLTCDKFLSSYLNEIEYNQTDLEDYITNYNSCTNSQTMVYGEPLSSKSQTNINLIGGVNFATLSLSDGVDYGSNIGWTAGVEIEFILPFNKNKWGFLIEPSFNRYSALTSVGETELEVNYSAFEIPFGIRHYFYTGNKGSKIFINALGVISFPPGSSEVDFFRSRNVAINASGNLAFGIGYHTGQKFMLELRYNHTRDLLAASASVEAYYRQFSIRAGYKLN